jgi:hypothetical protein
MYAYNQAIRDWEHYLRVDASGDWAAEAQRRLSELRDEGARKAFGHAA